MRHPIVEQALAMLACQVKESDPMTSPSMAKDYLQLLLADRPHEVFAVVFLDSQHRVLETVEMFRGTVSEAAVYPREVVVEALQRQAVAVILCHNHPSGVGEPSRADEILTSKLKAALSLMDIRVLDHFIVTRSGVTSFAERGLL